MTQRKTIGSMMTVEAFCSDIMSIGARLFSALLRRKDVPSL
jgi:hypothetical protein